MSQTEEKIYLERRAVAALQSNKKESQKPINLKEEDSLFIDQIAQKIDNWAADASLDSDKLEVGPFNSYQRFLLYQSMPERFENAHKGRNLVLSRSTTMSNVLDVAFLTKEQASEKAEASQKTNDNNLQASIGFRKVIDAIIEAKKPIVGHNCWLDLCHIYAKFIGPLPPSFPEFSREVLECFPNLMDTKYLATLLPELFPSGSLTSLCDLTAHFTAMQGLAVKQRKEQREIFHDAGYDSLCTGKVYVGLIMSLLKKSHSTLSIEEYLLGDELRSMANGRLFMMQSDYAFVSLNLSDQVHPDRDILCLLEDIGAKVQTSNILQALEAAGLKGVSVNWINQESAYLRFENAESAQSAAAMGTLEYPQDSKFPPSRIRSYKEIYDEGEGESSSLDNTDPKLIPIKRRSSDSIKTFLAQS